VIRAGRRDRTYDPDPLRDASDLVASLDELASGSTGFLPGHVPDYRFDGPLGRIADLAREAGSVYCRRDAADFRSWLAAGAGTLPGAAALAVDAEHLPLARREALTVPLIYLNHMWRQGDPSALPATGPSRLPAPLDGLLDQLAEATGVLPRFTQITMTVLAWSLAGAGPGQSVSYADLVDLRRLEPAFWITPGSVGEADLYRSFFAVETFGAPAFRLGCRALEAAAAGRTADGAEALQGLADALRRVYLAARWYMLRIDPEEFRRLQVTCGWTGDRLTGVASGYQLPLLLMMDAVLGVHSVHPGITEARANNLRFVPAPWLEFFDAVRSHRPTLRAWVAGSGDPELAAALLRCVELFTLFRTLHRHVGGRVMAGGTTTGRVFRDETDNHDQFVDEMTALVADTSAAATGLRP
jgi:hypothetical protein